MTEQTLRIVKIIATVLMVAGFIAFTFAMEWEHTEEKDQKAIESLQEVLKMKHQKQDCVDNLTALQTEEYLKGV
jgi:hypothetical protein